LLYFPWQHHHCMLILSFQELLGQMEANFDGLFIVQIYDFSVNNKNQNASQNL
jgi:hypothetical protein